MDKLLFQIAIEMVVAIKRKYKLKIRYIKPMKLEQNGRIWYRPWDHYHYYGYCSDVGDLEITVRDPKGYPQRIEEIADTVAHECAHIGWKRRPAYGEHDDPLFIARYNRYKNYLVNRFKLKYKRVR